MAEVCETCKGEQIVEIECPHCGGTGKITEPCPTCAMPDEDNPERRE